MSLVNRNCDVTYEHTTFEYRTPVYLHPQLDLQEYVWQE